MLTTRSDKKCGASGVPDNAQCTKPPKAALTKPKTNVLGLVSAGLQAGSAAYSTFRNLRNYSLSGGHASHGIAALGSAATTLLSGAAVSEYARGGDKGGRYQFAGWGTSFAGNLGALAYNNYTNNKQYNKNKSGYEGDDPFKDLGVTANASAADIRRAYIKKAQAAHPDRGGSAESMSKLAAAYKEALSRVGGPAKKARYTTSIYSGPRALPRADSTFTTYPACEVAMPSLRCDKRCGASGIPENATCHKGGSWPSTAAIGTALVAGGLTALAVSRATSAGPSASASPRKLPGDRTTRHLTGRTPRALLPPAPPRQSKTQRMRTNTVAAVRTAEGRIGQTAREEVRRIAQIGNTMAATGEAAGMATKTTLRELRLRAEAARRRWEPGYRRPDQRRLPGGVQAQLPGSGLTPERVSIPVDPRTGQPRRSRARGFGRRDSACLPGKSPAW